MNPDIDLNSIHTHIQAIKSAAGALAEYGHGFPSLDKNSIRILACVKMLELNVSDLVQLEEDRANEIERKKGL